MKQQALQLEEIQSLHDLIEGTESKISLKMKQLTALLSTNTFKGAPSYFSLKGRVLAAYTLMKEIKEEFAPALHAAGEIDAYLGFATMYEEHLATDMPYSFVEYVQPNEINPQLVIQDMWNPLVHNQNTTRTIIKNSISLGANLPNNIILTGPNGGGKSTFLKGVSLCVVLGQTIGMAPATYVKLSPFTNINTYMNITDDIGAGKSLFQAEVHRAQELVNSVTSLDKNSYSFSIIDEIFSGTAPREGAAASFAIAKRLGTQLNSILVLATHYPILTTLAEKTGNFRNYQVRVTKDQNGKIVYPFKLEVGKADQNIAFDILQEKGMNGSIIDDANEVLAFT